ncbi:MAG: hypothetical protein ACREV9_01620 [Burkholderiales bacterium]
MRNAFDSCAAARRSHLQDFEFAEPIEESDAEELLEFSAAVDRMLEVSRRTWGISDE